MSIFQTSEIIPQGISQAEKRVKLPAWNLLLRGGLSGAYIGMGACLMMIVTTGMDLSLGDGFTKFIAASVFPLGMIITILTGTELFAGDGMMTAFAAYRYRVSWTQVCRIWILVWIGNMAGAYLYGGIMAYGPYVMSTGSGETLATSFGVAAVSFAVTKCSVTGMAAGLSLLGKAFICGWIINIAVFLALYADDVIGKILGIWFPVMALMGTGFEHAVSNMALIGSGLLTALSLTPLQVSQVGSDIVNLGWIEMWNNLLIVSVGNLLGGLFFAALIVLSTAMNREES
jgi:formate/nitrite transporter